MGSKKRVMRSIVNLSTKLSLAALAVLFTVSAASANTLKEVQINAQDSGYGIVFKTDEAAQIKKTVYSDNKMTVELKNTEASSDLDTVYNDVTGVENVTIAPASKDSIKVTFKGEGIANSKLYFEKTQTAASLPAVNTQSQSIQVNAPVSSYTPVYNPEAFASDEDSEYSQTSNPKLNETLTKMHITRSMLVTVKSYIKKAVNKAKSGDINILTVLGIIFIIAAFMFKPKKAAAIKTPQKERSLTGIVPQRPAQIDREIGLNRRLADNMQFNNTVSPIKTGYGLNAYRQSQKNPYTSAIPQSTNGISGIARRKPLAGAPIKKQTLFNKPVPSKAATPVKAKAPSISNTGSLKQSKIPVSHSSSDAADMDSMKFLESITKIYEKSGRSDLAKGLKDNLRKAQISNRISV